MTDFANSSIQWGTTPNTITLLELTKQILGIADASKDDELSMYLEMAGIAAERYIDNIIEQREVTEHISKERTPVALRYWPVGDLSSVLIDGVEAVDQFTQAYDDGIGWVLKGISTLFRSVSFKQMDITYTAGYDPIPPEIGYAIARGAIAYESDSVAGGAVKKETIVGVGSIEYDVSSTSSASIGLLPSSSIAALNPYKRVHC